MCLCSVLTYSACVGEKTIQVNSTLREFLFKHFSAVILVVSIQWDWTVRVGQKLRVTRKAVTYSKDNNHP